MSSKSNTTDGDPRRSMKRKSPTASHSTPRAKKKKVEPKQPGPFLFLSLPPEIRNIIYGFAFVRPAGIHLAGRNESYTVRPSRFVWQRRDVRHSRGRTRRGNPNGRIPVSFLRCCRRVHGEARAMLYANRFSAEDMETLAAWLRDLGPGNIAHLRRIQLRTEPQRWSSWLSQRVEAQHGRYRAVCRKAAKMMAAAGHLESLQTVFYYHHKIIESRRSSLQRSGAVTGWMDLARKVAEVLYDDFRPILSQGLSRGRTPGQLCRVVGVEHSNWWGCRASLSPPMLNAADAERAEKEVVEHLRLLLERNLQRRVCMGRERRASGS
ncbi:hypothetical protein LX36DRAFT_668545 [Colletotrichum falcatum]|nr:hypothetical protein LX36DRAFT_668545 [Colletotrichum falcatum]